MTQALVVDRIGRVKSLEVSFITQGISLFLVAAFIRAAELADEGSDKRTSFGIASAAMVFIFLWCFTMFNIIPSWVYATEIWPQEIRAKGYSFTVLGWAVGCGVNTFCIPIMLDRLGWKTFLLFGCFNIISMPVVWFAFPETAGKSLEEVNLLFCSDSVLVKDNMREYQRMMDEAGGNVAVATRRLLDIVDEENGEPEKRRMSSMDEEKVAVHVEEQSASSLEGGK
jgi:MFS family permease